MFHFITKKGNDNVQITTWLHSFHTLARFCSKSFKLVFGNTLLGNWKSPDIHTGFKKGRGTRDQIANIHRIIEKSKGIKKKKNNYFCFIDYTKAFDYVHHNKLWRILRDGTRPPCQFPEKPVCRTRSNSWTLTWNNKLIQHVERSTSGLYTITLLMKLICRVRQGKYQSGWLPVGIKIARININNLRYEDDTTSMTENEKERKSPLMKVKEENEKAALKNMLDHWKKNSVGEGEGGMFQENSIKTCILSRVKRITSPGWMHKTSTWTWCTGKT